MLKNLWKLPVAFASGWVIGGIITVSWMIYHATSVLKDQADERLPWDMTDEEIDKIALDLDAALAAFLAGKTPSLDDFGLFDGQD